MKSAVLFLLVLISFCAKAQNDSLKFQKRWSLYTDLLLDALNETNVGAELKFHRRFTIGGSYGRVKPFEKDRARDIFILKHDINPGRVSIGHAYKLNSKFYVLRGESGYLKIEVLYKSLSYDSVRFSDMHITKEGSEGGISFERNEQTKVWGANVLFGGEWVKHYLYVDYFLGLGFRHKDRQYETYYNKSNSGSYYPQYAPIGKFTDVQNNLAIVIGLNFGFSYSKAR